MRILAGSLYYRQFVTGKNERFPKDENDLGSGNSGSNMCLHAIQAITNLVPSIDITGRRLFFDLYLLDGDAAQTKACKGMDSLDIKTIINPKKYGKINALGFGAIFIAKHFSVRDESFAKIPNSSIQPIVKAYIRASLQIIPPLVGLIGLSTSRAVIIAALDLMIALVGDEDNHPIFVNISDEMLYELVRLLWKNRLGADSLEYVDPVINMVTRVTSMKLLGGYDSAVDWELRDRSIELLEKLTSLSTDLKQRVGRKILSTPSDEYGISVAKATDIANTKLYDSIIPALTTKVGREQTPLLTAKFLRNLSSVPENSCGVMYLHRKLLKAVTTNAIQNEEVSDIIFNDVLNR